MCTNALLLHLRLVHCLNVQTTSVTHYFDAPHLSKYGVSAGTECTR